MAPVDDPVVETPPVHHISIYVDIPVSQVSGDTGALPVIHVEQSQPITPEPVVTRLIIIHDKSGSMATRANDVRGGFNSYIETLQKDGNQYEVSYYQFSDDLEKVFADMPVHAVEPLTKENYNIGGSTALYDALNIVLRVTKEKWETPHHAYGAQPVICVIDTDGEENSSHFTTRAAITDMITRRQKAGNWTFVFMGADQDAWAQASVIGLHQGNVLSYNGAETKDVYRRLATATSASATSSSTGGPIATHTFFDTSAPTHTGSSTSTTTLHGTNRTSGSGSE